MGVAYYGRYFEFFEQARAEMLRALGLPYSEIEREGTLLPVIEAHARYLRSATYDDLLEIETRIVEMPTVRIRIDYSVRKEGSPEVLVEGHTVHIFLNRDSRKPTRIPRSLATVLEQAFSEDHPNAE
jgi:acyl-CoA thioester hydrolase